MRILKVADVPDNRVGGMARVMYFTGDAMAAAGHSVDYIFGGQLGRPTDNPRWRRFTVPVRVVDLIRRRARGGTRYDVVELHEPLAGVYTWARSRDPSLPPCVAMSYALAVRERFAKIAYFARKKIRLTLKERYAPLSVIWQANYGIRRASHVICQTREDAAFVRSRMLVPECNVTVIPSGIASPFVEVAERGVPSAGGGVVFLGSWIDRKGIRDLVSVLSRLHAREPDVRMTIIGSGVPVETVWRDFPEGVRSSVRVIPRVDSDAELLALYRQHAVFIAPSYCEGSMLSLLEAAAAGLALLSTSSGGASDFVRHGENGLLVTPGDETALGQLLDRLVTDAELASGLGREAQRDVRRYTWERSAREMIAVFAKVLHSA